MTAIISNLKTQTVIMRARAKKAQSLIPKTLPEEVDEFINLLLNSISIHETNDNSSYMKSDLKCNSCCVDIKESNGLVIKTRSYTKFYCEKCLEKLLEEAKKELDCIYKGMNRRWEKAVEHNLRLIRGNDLKNYNEMINYNTMRATSSLLSEDMALSEVPVVGLSVVESSRFGVVQSVAQYNLMRKLLAHGSSNHVAYEVLCKCLIEELSSDFYAYGKEVNYIHMYKTDRECLACKKSTNANTPLQGREREIPATHFLISFAGDNSYNYTICLNCVAKMLVCYHGGRDLIKKYLKELQNECLRTDDLFRRYLACLAGIKLMADYCNLSPSSLRAEAVGKAWWETGKVRYDLLYYRQISDGSLQIYSSTQDEMELMGVEEFEEILNRMYPEFECDLKHIVG